MLRCIHRVFRVIHVGAGLCCGHRRWNWIGCRNECGGHTHAGLIPLVVVIATPRRCCGSGYDRCHCRYNVERARWTATSTLWARSCSNGHLREWTRGCAWLAGAATAAPIPGDDAAATAPDGCATSRGFTARTATFGHGAGAASSSLTGTAFFHRTSGAPALGWRIGDVRIPLGWGTPSLRSAIHVRKRFADTRA